jgi:AcrR family transcriptional regulator
VDAARNLPVVKQHERKARTRAQLLSAGYELFGREGLETTSIAAITEHASLGFGTFYAHFASKSALVDALRDDVVARFIAPVEQVVLSEVDTAVALGSGLRLMLARLRAAPMECRYVVETMATDRSLRMAVVAFLYPVVARGVQQQRLHSDVDVSALALLTGGFRGYLRMCQEDGIDSTELDERFVAAALRALGVGALEATSIARLPLPDVVEFDPDETEPITE